MIEKIKELVFNKSFLLGIVLAVGTFFHYIFGNDNLAEQVSECIIKHITGQEVDFTPENSK